jgi:hypothetical protein
MRARYLPVRIFDAQCRRADIFADVVRQNLIYPKVVLENSRNLSAISIITLTAGVSAASP